MILLGIDPGIGTTGFGVIEQKTLNSYTFIECGVIKTPPNTPLAGRLLQLSNDFGALLDRIKPEAVAIEQLFFGRNVTTAFTVGQARGVMLLELARRGHEFGEYTPLQIKMSVAGYGRATKTQVQQMVVRLLNLKKVPRPDDAADGLAIALCHGFSLPMLKHKNRVAANIKKVAPAIKKAAAKINKTGVKIKRPT